MLSRLLVWFFVTVVLGSFATATDEYLTNESEDIFGVPHRLKISAFHLLFHPFIVVTQSRTDMIEMLASDLLRDVFPTRLSDGITLDYVNLVLNLADTRRRTLTGKNESAVLEFVGVASFRGGAPAVEEVNEWTREALEGGSLLEILRDETELNTVERIEFMSLTPAPSPYVINGVSNIETSPSNASAHAASIAVPIVTIAAVCLMIGIWKTSNRRRHEQTIEITESEDSIEKPTTELTEVDFEACNKIMVLENVESTEAAFKGKNGIDGESLSMLSTRSNATDAATAQSNDSKILFCHCAIYLPKKFAFQRTKR